MLSEQKAGPGKESTCLESSLNQGVTETEPFRHVEKEERLVMETSFPFRVVQRG